MTTLPPEISSILDALTRAARASRHRRMLVLAGDAHWGRAIAIEIGAAGDTGSPAWLTRAAMDADVPTSSNGQNLLGRDLDLLVVDAHAGLDPDALGAATGAVCGGGLVLMLTPPLVRWPGLADAEAERVAVHPYSAAEVGDRMIRRLARCLVAAEGVALFEQDAEPLEPPADHPPPGIADAAASQGTPDQHRAVDAIIHTARGRARRPLVLRSDRGRGKSAALGIAAARLMVEDGLKVLVTAPRRSSVDTLFAHAAKGLPEAGVERNRLSLGEAELRFSAPDDIDRAQPSADLLLVDEAAGIPTPLLARLLAGYPRIIFATTVHGYEGSGRGFDLRFADHLSRHTPGWRQLRLEQPIRWANRDPIEALIGRALLLDAEAADDELLAGVAPEQCRFELLDRDCLAADEPLLRDLFGLLVLAHYQTRPLDLRHLLDGPNVRIYALRFGGRVVATAMVALEGGFDAELTGEVFAGRRRPRGHLLPQTLSAHGGLAEAPMLRHLRLVRLATHPAARRIGLGRRLITEIIEHAGHEVDCIGASFGAAPELIGFWRGCGLEPVQLGSSRNAASGTHALVVLRGLSEHGQELASRAVERFAERLPAQLCSTLRDLEPALALALLACTGSMPPRLTGEDIAELAGFAWQQRGLDAVQPLLWRLWLESGATLAASIEPQPAEALLARVVLGRSWSEVAALLGVSGRTAAEKALRLGLRPLASRCLKAAP